jgi:hypothetical protein
MITIKERFGIIQKLLVPGFETKIEIFTPPWVQRPIRIGRCTSPSPAPRSTFCGFEGGRYMITI